MPTAASSSAIVDAMSSNAIVNDVRAIDFETIISIELTSDTGTCGSSCASAARTPVATVDGDMEGARTTMCMPRDAPQFFAPGGPMNEKYASSIADSCNPFARTFATTPTMGNAG